jgi:hypothetical protein
MGPRKPRHFISGGRRPAAPPKAGMDMLCIGNNLRDQEREMAGIADAIAQGLGTGMLDRTAIG